LFFFFSAFPNASKYTIAMAGGLKEVRDRIASVKNTQQITKAMKMVSAAKLRRAQQAIQEVRPYARKLNDMLRNILSNLEGEAGSAYGVERPVNSVAIVVISSDRGLAGAFNTNIAKEAALLLNKEPYASALANGQLEIIPIGKKGADFFRKRYPRVRINREFIDVTQDASFANVSRVSQYLMDRFTEGSLDRVDVVYSYFRNAAIQNPQAVQYLPVQKTEAIEGNTQRVDYIFEPGKEELLNYLVPTILQTTFHAYVLDVAAGEHGARMTAMDKATENADEILRSLKIKYNKARQEVITSELAEIVGGAAALEG
jgi:ATP synthase, F1 gamma subunit